MSTWKLAKKLKETHLSPFQRSSNDSSANSNSNNNDSSERLSSERKRDVLSLPSVTTQSKNSLSDQAPSPTGTSQSSSKLNSRSNTISESTAAAISYGRTPVAAQQQDASLGGGGVPAAGGPEGTGAGAAAAAAVRTAANSSTAAPTSTNTAPGGPSNNTSHIAPASKLTASKTLTNNDPRLRQPQSEDQSIDSTSATTPAAPEQYFSTAEMNSKGQPEQFKPAPIPAPVESQTQHEGPSTSTITPGLLTVSVKSAQGLTLPPSHSQYSSVLGQALGGGQDGVSTSPRKQASSFLKRRPPVYIVLDYDKTQVVLEASSGTVEAAVWDKLQSFDVSRAETLNIQVFTRVPLNHPGGPLGNSFYDTPMSVGGASRTGNRKKFEDVFLGSCKVTIASPSGTRPTSIVDGLIALTSGSGKLQLKIDFKPNSNKHLTIDDFDLLKVVGRGSFGKVMQVRKKDTQRVYALKTIRKAHIVSRSEVNHTLAERTVLAQIDNPFIVPLKFSFQSPEKLYLVLAFVNGGELFHHLQREGRFDLNRSRFYTAELLCALECLHDFNVIYRDLKPENILLDYTGHIALCDFGLCKLNMQGQDKTNTFCGTPEYLAPELIVGQGYTKVVDWWTLGVLFYEMLTGLPPFYDQDVNEMYRRILQDPLRFPEDMDREARSLLQGLLDRDPKKRLGINGASEIKAHPFFAQIDWKRLMAKKYAAPFKPAVESATDTSNFDQEFTAEEPTDSVVDKEFYLSESVQQQFGGWTYTNNDSKLATSSGRW